MKIKTLPAANSTINEILDFINNIIGSSYTTIENKIPDIIESKPGSRYKKIKFETTEVTFIFNFFGILDICIIEFNDLKKSSECYELCNKRFKSTQTHLWFDRDILIEFYTSRVGNRGFRFCLKPLSREELKQT